MDPKSIALRNAGAAFSLSFRRHLHEIVSLVFAGRERMISPAELQGILGMMAHDRRTGSTGFPSFPPGLFGPRGGSRASAQQVQLQIICILPHDMNNNTESHSYVYSIVHFKTF